jgi:hypothetical protein
MDMSTSRRQILYSRESPELQPLQFMMEGAGHRALVLWALDCAEGTLAAFEAECPGEPRPRIALEKSARWARGEIRMPEARHAILDAHAVAKEVDDRRIKALAHAIGQAGSTVHVGAHAPGLAFYELTAVALGAGGRRDEAVAERIGFYLERLEYWQAHEDDPGRSWAKFLRAEKP